MLQYMKPIEPHTIPRVLLLGNGIHRAFHEESWDALLRDMTDDRFSDDEWEKLSNVHYPLLAVIASHDSLKEKMREKGAVMSAQLPAEKEKQLLSLIPSLGFDAVLTSNYTYEIEKSIIASFSCVPGKKCKSRHFTSQNKPKAETEALYTFMAADDNMLPPIWHIHGEAARPDTMVIGHYYYGKLLSRIQSYVAETVRRYKIQERAAEPFYPRSWVDYFLFGDVTIIGLGMSLCEMDLWWLMNCKKRNGRGKITFIEPNLSNEKKMLADAYGVTVITPEVGENGYSEYYEQILRSLKAGEND